MIVGNAYNTFELSEETYTPQEFKLLPAYPNPFNPATNISYSIPESQVVELSVYDIMGRHIDTILHKKLDAGYYDIHWKPFALPTGIYFLNIQTDQSDLTHKVMYIK